MLQVAEQRRMYNVTDAAQLLGVSRVSVWRWIRDGRLPATRLGHRTVRITREDLDHIIVQLGPVGSRVRVAHHGDAAAEHEGAPSAAWPAADASEHVVQFYETDAVLLDAVAEFIGLAVRAGDAGIVIATAPHRMGLAERFQASGVDLEAAVADGRYVALDAGETLAQVMSDGTPDPERFAAVIGRTIARAGSGGRRVRAFGEMVALLAIDGNPAAALHLEALWNALQQTCDLALYCAYPMDCLGDAAVGNVLSDICAAHSRVVPAESYAALSSAVDRDRAVALLQQKARWLDAEVAERERVEEQLRAALAAEQIARAAAETALRVRDEFLAVAAHELRTPLAGLSGQAQLTLRRVRRDERLGPERIALALEGITVQAAKLSRLIDRLLDLSRLEAGKLALERQPTDLAALVAQVVNGARLASDQHVITLDAPPSLEMLIDPLRLEQVLTNLLDNAIKYSPAGSPVEVVLMQMATGMVELAVRDYGIGIPLEKRDSIFERFSQAHGEPSHGGLGLGLYVSRQIVELHGGAVHAEFPPDGGTRFVVRLPIGVAEAAVGWAAD